MLVNYAKTCRNFLWTKTEDYRELFAAQPAYRRRSTRAHRDVSTASRPTDEVARLIRSTPRGAPARVRIVSRC